MKAEWDPIFVTLNHDEVEAPHQGAQAIFGQNYMNIRLSFPHIHVSIHVREGAGLTDTMYGNKDSSPHVTMTRWRPALLDIMCVYQVIIFLQLIL